MVDNDSDENESLLQLSKLKNETCAVLCVNSMYPVEFDPVKALWVTFATSRHIAHIGRLSDNRQTEPFSYGEENHFMDGIIKSQFTKCKDK